MREVHDDHARSCAVQNKNGRFFFLVLKFVNLKRRKGSGRLGWTPTPEHHVSNADVLMFTEFDWRAHASYFLNTAGSTAALLAPFRELTSLCF